MSVNGSAVPQFELRDLKFTDKTTSVLVTGKIVQEDAPDTLATPLPLFVSIAGKNIFIGRVFVEGHETTFHVSAPVHARKIMIDPEQTVLARSK